MSVVECFEPQLVIFISQEMTQEPAHDLGHVQRVVKTARLLSHQENAQLDVVLPAAYLHDCIILPKHHSNRDKSSLLAADKAVQFLQQINYPKELLNDIHHAICAHSFSANINPTSLEAKIVQDADRLDALGAIGISRCMMVSTNFCSSIYHPDDPFCNQRNLDDKRYTIDHFYRKLFKLASTMNTPSAKQEAQKRTEYMRGFLEQLKNEIDQ